MKTPSLPEQDHQHMWNKFLSKKQLWICILIFFTCIYVYSSNKDVFILSGDTTPNSLIGFNWLFNHTLNFDNFRNGYLYGAIKACGTECVGMNTPYFFKEAPNGHLVSVYPAGSAIITFPLYFCFFCYLKLKILLHNLLFSTPFILPDIADPAFETYRITFEKLASNISTSLSVVIFYLCLNLKFNIPVALITSFIYAFATNTWTTSSQALWQHGASNLVTVSALLCLLKANRANQKEKHLLLILCGFFCGLLPGIRPTSLLFSITFITYSIFAYRMDSLFLLIGLPSILTTLFWNLNRFGFTFENLIKPSNILIGRYAVFSDSFLSSLYNFSPQQFCQSFLGVLISPTRGLFIYSPVTLFAFPGANKVLKLARFGKDEKLISCLLIGSLIILFQFGFYTQWHGGWSYGPRLMTDLLPTMCFLIAYCLDHLFSLSENYLSQVSKIFRVGVIGLLVITIIYSTFTQVVGSFGFNPWDAVPVSSTIVQSRLWSWRDSQIERSTNALYYRISEPVKKPSKYLNTLVGIIRNVSNSDDKPISSPLLVKPSEQMFLKVHLVNRGDSQWYGYETGMWRDLMLVKFAFFKKDKTQANALVDTLFVSGNPKRREKAIAVGNVVFPSEPGEYKMKFSLAVLGRLQPKHEILKRPFELDVKVLN
jgi:hypothetical protein